MQTTKTPKNTKTTKEIARFLKGEAIGFGNSRFPIHHIVSKIGNTYRVEYGCTEMGGALKGNSYQDFPNLDGALQSALKEDQYYGW